MKNFRITSFLGLAALALGPIASAYATQDAALAAKSPDNLASLHDFDFLVGDWQVHHRRLKERLVGSHEWIEFDGTLSMHQLMNGWANVGDNLFNLPSGPYRGVGLRAYDATTGQWASWCLDGRNPFGDLDPPVKGHFANGVGIFLADDVFNGQTVRVRVRWTFAAGGTPRWEQSYSTDGGKTWEINWISDFTKAK